MTQKEPFVTASLGKLKTKRRPRFIVLSVALHVVAIYLLGSILFEYPVGTIFGIASRAARVPQERITYVEVAPAPGNPAADTGAGPAPAPDAPEPAPQPGPRQLPQAPVEVPQGVEPAPAAPPQAGGVPGGRGGGGGAGGTGPGTGMVPSYSDSRIWAPPGPFTPAPKTQRQVVDSVIDVAVGAFLDSMRVVAANKGRDAGDWTWGKEGTKWGVDPKWIYFGKVKIPTAILALLPVNAQQNPSFNARERAAIRWDINYHANRAITEDEFRQSVKRIRERAERERAARKANGGEPKPAAAPVP